jgi:hypothetical protein
MASAARAGRLVSGIGVQDLPYGVAWLLDSKLHGCGKYTRGKSETAKITRSKYGTNTGVEWHFLCDTGWREEMTMEEPAMSSTAVTYEEMLATMAEDATQLHIAALQMESLIPLVTGKLQKARIALTAAVLREKCWRIERMLNFVRSTETKPGAEWQG